jgi:large subunit ribosomal protein L25
MKRLSLEVKERKVLGRDVKKLRREGIMPANIYGKDIKSETVQVALSEFEKVYKEAGETGLVDLKVDSKITPVLIHGVQTNYLGKPLHADFYVVNLTEKVRTNVPLELVGEPKAVTDKIGLLMHILNEVEVEALPTELPEKIEVNVEQLAQIDEQVTVADVKAPTGVTILSDPNQVVAKIGELITKEAQEQAAAEAAASEAAKAEGTPAEGAPAEGSAEEKPQESEESPKEESPAQ